MRNTGCPVANINLHGHERKIALMKPRGAFQVGDSTQHRLVLLAEVGSNIEAGSRGVTFNDLNENRGCYRRDGFHDWVLL